MAVIASRMPNSALDQPQLVDGVLDEDALAEHQPEVGHGEHRRQRSQQSVAPQPTHPVDSRRSSRPESAAASTRTVRIDTISIAANANEAALTANGSPTDDVEQEGPDREAGDAAGDDLGREQQAVGAPSMPPDPRSSAGTPGRRCRTPLRSSRSRAAARATARCRANPALAPSGTTPNSTDADDVGGDHQAPPIVAVDHDTDREGQQQPGHEHGDAVSASSRASSVSESASNGIATKLMPSPRLLITLAVHCRQ